MGSGELTIRAAASAGAWRDGGRESARTGPTPLQYAAVLAFSLGLAVAIQSSPLRLVGGLHLIFLTVFGFAAALRSVLVAATVWRPPEPPATVLPNAELPAYSVIVPLLREGAMVQGLLAALARLDYPRDRLQILLALERDDPETRLAVARAALPPDLSVRVVLAPAAGPRTKPKACNAALAYARGRYVTIYDAEDRPEPGQLREAAARFAAGPPELGCLQAPLRIAPGAGWLQRQFQLEYAALFEVMLPAYARLGLAFPLGGTSNHFRRIALKGAGGWDPWNVTEDADMGLRLAALGWRLGVLTTPTWECAPRTLDIWTPQRTRWVKGHMQTWGVHMRRPLAGGWRRALGLQLTLGLSVLSSLLHGALASGVAACLLLAATSGAAPRLDIPDLWLFVGGWGSAILCMDLGERRRGGRMLWRDAFSAPFYWPMQSLAAIFAVWQLATKPFHWDKTPHEPQDAPSSSVLLRPRGT